MSLLRDRPVPQATSTLPIDEEFEIFEVPTPEVLPDGSILVPTIDPDTQQCEKERYVPAEWIDEQEKKVQKKVQEMESRIEMLRSGTKRSPSFAEPCFFCYRFVRDTQCFVQFACCNRVGHITCLLRTQYRNGNSLVEDFCPTCHSSVLLTKTEELRAELIRQNRGESDDTKPIPPTPRGVVMLNVCILCGLLTDKKIWLRSSAFTQPMVDTVFEAFNTITVETLYQHGVTFEKLRAAGMSLYHVIRCFNIKEESLFDHVTKKVPNIKFDKRGLESNEHEVGALLEAGVDSKVLRKWGLDMRDLMQINLGAEALLILGFSAVDFLAMGMQKSVIPKFTKITQEEWFVLLGLDRVCVYMLGLKENDFTEGVLKTWSQEMVISKLNLKPSEVSSFIDSTQKKTKRHVLE